MKQLSNAIVFTATLPTAEAIATHMAEVLHTPILENVRASAGFKVNDVTGELVTPLVGINGFSIQLQYDEKVIPTAVIKTQVDELVKKTEKETGFPITRKQKSEVKDNVIAALLPTALVKSTIVNAYYDADSKYLVVDTTQKKFADTIINLLINCCGSVKTETINVNSVKLGLSAKVSASLNGDEEALNGFNLGSSCKLIKRGTKEKTTYQDTDLELISDTLKEDLEQGYEFDNAEMCRSTVSFTLTNKFFFKSFSYSMFKLDEDCKDDKAYSFRYEAGVKMLLVVDIINSMCDLVGYKESDSEESGDVLTGDVKAFVIETRRASVSGIQREFKIDYNRAARIIEELESMGVVSAPCHNGTREVLVF